MEDALLSGKPQSHEAAKPSAARAEDGDTPRRHRCRDAPLGAAAAGGRLRERAGGDPDLVLAEPLREAIFLVAVVEHHVIDAARSAEVKLEPRVILRLGVAQRLVDHAVDAILSGHVRAIHAAHPRAHRGEREERLDWRHRRRGWKRQRRLRRLRRERRRRWRRRQRRRWRRRRGRRRHPRHGQVVDAHLAQDEAAVASRQLEGHVPAGSRAQRRLRGRRLLPIERALSRSTPLRTAIVRGAALYSAHPQLVRV